MGLFYVGQLPEVDSLAQLVEHIPFKDGVLGSSPKRVTEKDRLRFIRACLAFLEGIDLYAERE